MQLKLKQSVVTHDPETKTQTHHKPGAVIDPAEFGISETEAAALVAKKAATVVGVPEPDEKEPAVQPTGNAGGQQTDKT